MSASPELQEKPDFPALRRDLVIVACLTFEVSVRLVDWANCPWTDLTDPERPDFPALEIDFVTVACEANEASVGLAGWAYSPQSSLVGHTPGRPGSGGAS